MQVSHSFAPKYRRQVIYKDIKADIRNIMQKKRYRNNRSGMLPGSHPHVSKDTAKVFCIRSGGVFERKKFTDDI